MGERGSQTSISSFNSKGDRNVGDAIHPINRAARGRINGGGDGTIFVLCAMHAGQSINASYILKSNEMKINIILRVLENNIPLAAAIWIA